MTIPSSDKAHFNGNNNTANNDVKVMVERG